MVRSRIESAAPAETTLIFPGGLADFTAQLEPPPDLIVVALQATRLPWAELVSTARSNSSCRDVPILAFGPHKDLELRQRALAAGVDRVLANSAFMLALPGLLRGEVTPVASRDD